MTRYNRVELYLFIHISGEALSLVCHQCKSTPNKISPGCLSSKSDTLKKCPKGYDYCVIVEEYSKNGK